MAPVGPPPVEEELNLLTEWGDPNARTRTPKAAVASLFLHVALITTLMYLPAGSNQPPAPEEPPHIVTPLVLPTELTQKAPNKGKITKEFDAREEAPRKALNLPPSPRRWPPNRARPVPP